jgi:hypothetical protein
MEESGRGLVSMLVNESSVVGVHTPRMGMISTNLETGVCFPTIRLNSGQTKTAVISQ